MWRRMTIGRKNPVDGKHVSDQGGQRGYLNVVRKVYEVIAIELIEVEVVKEEGSIVGKET